MATRRPHIGSILAFAALALVSARAFAGVKPDDWRLRSFSPHHALFFNGSPPGIWNPARTKVYAEALGLTQDQLDTLEAMILDGDREIAQEWVRRREAEMDQRLGDPALKESKREEFDSGVFALRAFRDRLVGTIEQDMELMLSEEQSPRWEQAAPTMRREIELAEHANLDMEPREVGALVEALDLPDAARAKVDPIVEQYRIDLDAMILARVSALDALETAIKEASLIERNDWRNGGRRGGDASEFAEADAVVVRRTCAVLEQSERISALNARTLELVRGELDDEARGRLDVLVRLPTDFSRRNYYGAETDAHRAFQAVDTLSTRLSALSIAPVSGRQWSVNVPRNTSVATGAPLTRSQQQRVDALRASFEDSFAEILVRFGDAPPTTLDGQHWVQVRTRSGTVYLEGVDRPDWNPNSAEAERRKRLQEASNDLTLKTVRELREILTPEQRVVMSCWVQ